MLPRFREVLPRVRQMVVGGRNEEQVHRLGDLETVAAHRHRPECRDPTMLGGTAQVVERAAARVERVDDAIRFDGAGQAEGEMPRARTEIAHDHPGPEVEDRDDRVRVAQAILAGPAGVQPPADRSGQSRSGQAVASWATLPCWRIRIALPNGSRMPMSVP
jgi:hypothetical protein